jgi:hypothetical protein
MNLKTILLFSVLFVVATATAYLYFHTNPNNDYKKDDDNIDTTSFRDFNFEETTKNFVPPPEDIKQRNINFISEGNSIVCDSLQTVTGNNISSNYEFKIKDGSLRVDCYDKTSNIAVDYKSEKNYKYNKDDNVTLIDFYNSLYLNQIKENILLNNKIEYHKIPYLVDKCYKVDDDNYNCETLLTQGIRKNRMVNYLREIVF